MNESSSLLSTLWANPFYRGMLIGLCIGIFLWIRSFLRIRELSRQVAKLKEHLHTKLEIDAEETERRKQEIERLREERDNLRNTVQVLSQKPSRQELRQAQVYQRAIDIMFEKAPGFAPAWQITLKEAEEEMRKAERGIIPFFKRLRTSPQAAPDYEKAREKALHLEEPSAN